jgi:hypothetical protein
VDENIGISGHWLFTWHDKAGNIIETREEKNLITTSGLNSLAALFIGEILQSAAMYLALGTGTTPAVSEDPKLEMEGFRKIMTSKTRNLNEVRLRFFLATTEANGDWAELGVFLAATGIQDSGYLLNRVLPAGGVSKVANQTLTVEVRITFSAT